MTDFKSEKNRCCEKVFGSSRFDSFNTHQCMLNAVVVRDGKQLGLKTLYSCEGHIGKDRIFRPYISIDFKGKEISVIENRLNIYWDWRR